MFDWKNSIFLMPTIHLLIKGKVQGVFYRASAKATAEKLNLTGWVKNTQDVHVEALVTGEEEALQQFITWCRKGPTGAVVTEVVASPAPDSFFTGFSVMRD
jgi:acylphosphatase